MNELIQSIFQNFTVDGKEIPVAFLQYNGHETTYVTYMEMTIDNSLSGDDDLIGYVDYYDFDEIMEDSRRRFCTYYTYYNKYYDFDIYSKGNYTKIIEKIKQLMKDNDFVWQPSRTSHDMYEVDTGYYHKTLCFATYKEVNNG